MKVLRTKITNYKLFQYNLLQLQIYSKISRNNTKVNFSANFYEQVEAYLKQVFKIIYKYHIHCFKILFIGFPIVSKIKQKKLIHFTNHHFILEKSWLNGIIKNRFSILTYLKIIQSPSFLKSYQLLLTIKKKPHLVVIFTPKFETNALNEFYSAGIPLIIFNWSLTNNLKNDYKTLGNFNFTEKNVKSIFFFLFFSLLKKLPFKKKAFCRRRNLFNRVPEKNLKVNHLKKFKNFF